MGDVTSNILAGFALLLSCVSLYFSWRAQQSVDRQEGRRKLRIRPSLLNGYFEKKPEGHGRVYAFFLSISNPSDADNAVAAVDMHLSYLTTTRVLMTVKLASNNEYAPTEIRSSGAPLTIPARVAAHDTISGWCYFPIEGSLLEGVQVEGYKIVLTDSHQLESSVEPIIVQEISR